MSDAPSTMLHPDGPGTLRGDRAVVTGAARGIGREIALELGRSGTRVAVFDVLDPSDTVARIESEGGTARGFRVDVTDPAAVEEAMTAAVESWGGLDILITAAGVYGDTVSITELEESEVDRVLAVNTKGVLWCVRSALPALRVRGGRVVCVGSVAGKVGGVLAGPHYVASKGGVHAIVKWLAKTEAVNGIVANGVAPGVVDTEMIADRGYRADYCPMGRFARAEEIARSVVFLASPAASYLTGAVVDVNGGYHMG